MSIKKQVLHILSRTIMTAFFLGGGGVNYALAACGSGGQCKVDDGSEVTLQGGHYASFYDSATGDDFYALEAYDGSKITGINLELDDGGNSIVSVMIGDGGKIELENSTITGSAGSDSVAIWGTDSSFTMFGGTIIVEDRAIYASDSAQINLGNVTINGEYMNIAMIEIQQSQLQANNLVMNIADGYYGEAIAVFDSQMVLNGGQITVQGTGMTGLRATQASDVLFNTVKINIEDEPLFWWSIDAAGIVAGMSANIEIRDSSVTANKAIGMNVSEGATAIIDNSLIITSGHEKSHGLTLLGALVNVRNGSIIEAENASAVEADWLPSILNVEDSRLSGGSLVTSGSDGGKLTINARNAQLFGNSFIRNSDILTMNLQAGTQWELHPNSNGDNWSDVSFLSLADSHISFVTPDDPLDEGLYQILRIGVGNLEDGPDFIYTAGNNALISFNTYLNEDGDLSNQFTDRLLINGDVSGITTIQIREMAGSPGGLTSASGSNRADEGISLIQVQGLAAENSFSLAGGYTTMSVQPYRYELYAYGPGSSRGLADASQKLVGGSGNDHWDFRLQNVFQEQTSFFNDPAPELVPQAANYLVSPLALMQAGLLDLGTLHQRLGDIRGHMAQAKMGKRSEYFLIGYNGDYRYHSNLKRNQYGYDTDFRYGAARLGGNIYGFESDKGMARFGLSASRGNLSLEPRHIQDSQKTGFDVWTMSAYFTYAGVNGFYFDAIASYGGFGGDVTSTARGRTAKIGGHMTQTSMEMGMPFALGANGLEIEPHLQLIYQQFDFNDSYDRGDGFAVHLGKHEQFLARIGGHLTKKFKQSLTGRDVEISARFDYIHAFKDGGNVWLGDDFRLGDFGNHIEAGLGFNARSSDNTSFYGEASWQQRVGNAGFSGIRFNGGLRMQF